MSGSLVQMWSWKKEDQSKRRRGQNTLTTCEPEGNFHSSFRRLHMLKRTNSNRRCRHHSSVFTWNQGLFCMCTVMAQWNDEDNNCYFQNKYTKHISVHQPYTYLIFSFCNTNNDDELYLPSKKKKLFKCLKVDTSNNEAQEKIDKTV